MLSGTNTYSGGTFVEGGVLELANPAAIANGASLIVGGKAFVDFGSAIPSAQPAGSFNAALPANRTRGRYLRRLGNSRGNAVYKEVCQCGETGGERQFMSSVLFYYVSGKQSRGADCLSA